MKKLTRIQLVNWHFFENEQICLNGSTLISGENTAGKSTSGTNRPGNSR